MHGHTSEKTFLTFDCYGTLIDWETGIKNAFQTITGKDAQRTVRIFDLYEEEERRIEKKSYRSYKDVLSQALTAAAKRVGLNLSKPASESLMRELPRWKPFPETNESLEKLAKNHPLGILSNVDDDLLAGTLKNFTVEFKIIVTAERVRSYKPNLAHFKEAARMIGKSKWLHVAASLYHDIEPTSQLGIDSVWVNRKHVKPDTFYANKIKKRVSDLSQLVELLNKNTTLAG